MQPTQQKRSTLAIILFTIFIDLVGIGILIPVIPQLLANPQSPEYLLPAGYTLQWGYFIFGLLTASYPIAQFFATPILGQLSDRFGRKPVLAISLAGTSLSYILFAVGIYLRSIPLLFISRILDGITGGNISVAQAVIADITTPENRSKNFGLIGAAFGIGFIIGPFIGGQLADPSIVPWFSAATPFWFAAILAFINMLSVLFIFKETNLHPQHTPLTWDQSIRNILRAIALKELRTLFLTGFLYQGGFAFFTSFFGVFLIARHGFTQGSIGNLFAYIGIWIAFTQAVVTRKVSTMYGERAVINLTMTISGIAVLFFILPDNWHWMLLTIPVFSIMNGLTQANLTGFLSRSADQKMQGEILGINASLAALAQSVPPILSGAIAAKFAPSTPVIVGAVIMIGAGFVFIVGYRRRTVD